MPTGCQAGTPSTPCRTHKREPVTADRQAGGAEGSRVPEMVIRKI